MIKILALAGGLCGAAGVSQYPEFAQQYTQRLAGQVDALTEVVEDFDNSALEADLTRAQALAEMTGSEFLDARAVDMRRTFVRHAVLSETLADLRAATPMQRMLMPHRLTDTETFANTWTDFSPALPISVAGLASAAVGFGASWLVLVSILALIKQPFRRRYAHDIPHRRPQPQSGHRVDPPVQRASGTDAPRPGPRLLGETRR